jgi:hypothetical protein
MFSPAFDMRIRTFLISILIALPLLAGSSRVAEAQWQNMAMRIGSGLFAGAVAFIIDYDFGPIDNIGCPYGYTFARNGYDYFGKINGQTAVQQRNTCDGCFHLVQSGGGTCDKHTDNSWDFTNSDILGGCDTIAVYSISLGACGTYYTQCLAAGVPSKYLACFQ